MLENELQYHGLAERSKSTNDASISCENFVKFGPVTSELTVLICERQVRHGRKTGVKNDCVMAGDGSTGEDTLFRRQDEAHQKEWPVDCN